MHGLQYSLDDFSKIYKKKIKIKLIIEQEEVFIIGKLVGIHPTTFGEKYPHSINLEINNKVVTNYRVEEIEFIEVLK